MARKIGKVNRKPNTLVWVDSKGNVWEKSIVRKKKGSRRKK